MCTPLELLKVTPITTVDVPLTYSERTMRTIANTALAFVPSTTEPRSVFVRNFLQNLEPWLNVSKDHGKMTTRITNYLFKHYDKAEISKPYQSAIGSFLAAEAPTGAFHYDITNKLNWKKGDFGDAGSCFMGGRTNVLCTMEDEGGFALRFWKKSKDGMFSGMARAWLMPHPSGEPTPILFNAYGCSLDQYASRLRVILDDVPMRLVYLDNYGSNTGDFYINQRMGLVLGSEGMDWQETLDFNLSTTSRDERCAECGVRGVDINPLYDVDGSILGNYCRDCLDDMDAEQCGITGNWCVSEAMEEVTVIGRTYYDRGIPLADPTTIRASSFTLARYQSVRYTCDKCQHIHPFNGTVQVCTKTGRINVCYHCAAPYSMSCRHCGAYLMPDESIHCTCSGTRAYGPAVTER